MARRNYDPNHYYVYVIELSEDVLKDRKFLRANPDYQKQPGRPPLYVGMTGRTPEIRLEQHRAKYKSNRYVRRWSVKLRQELVKGDNPMSWEAAQRMEVELTNNLREEGYAVWQH